MTTTAVEAVDPLLFGLTSDSKPFVGVLLEFQEDLQAVAPTDHIGRLFVGDGTDDLTYLEQMMQVLKGIPEYTERQAPFFVGQLLDFFTADFEPLYSEDYAAGKRDGDTLGRKAAAKILSGHLSLIASWSNPKQLARAPEIFQILLELLAKSSTELQQLSLTCLQRWKLKYVNPYLDHLRNIISDDHWREQLTLFHIAESAGIVAAPHREQLVAIVLRIIYAKLLQRKGKHSQRYSLQAKRKALLAWLNQLTPTELAPLVNLLLQPFERCFNDKLPRSDAIAQISLVPRKKQVGFLMLLHEVIKQLSQLLIPFVPQFCSVLLLMLEAKASLKNTAAEHESESDDDDDDDMEEETAAAGAIEDEDEGNEGREENEAEQEGMKAEGAIQKVGPSDRKMQAASWRKVGQLSLLRLSSIFREYPLLDYSHLMPRFLDAVSVRSFPPKRA